MPAINKLDCIGIDDWAKRKGMEYGTIIVDADTGRPIDLLDSRASEDVVDWLSNHKDIKFVTRDRATAYASAITKAISEAKQIADRFHLVKNLSDAIQEEIRLEYSQLKKVSTTIYAGSEPTNSIEKSRDVISGIPNNDNANIKQGLTAGMKEKKEKLAQIIKMKENGLSISEIARKTQMSRHTVGKYLEHGLPSTARSTSVNYNGYI